jgi:hypothetical protein
MENEKFLVRFLHGFSHHQLFFLFWFALVVVFVLLMIGHYRKNVRRNFRNPNDTRPKVHVDARRLSDNADRHPVVKKD